MARVNVLLATFHRITKQREALKSVERRLADRERRLMDDIARALAGVGYRLTRLDEAKVTAPARGNRKPRVRQDLKCPNANAASFSDARRPSREHHAPPQAARHTKGQGCVAGIERRTRAILPMLQRGEGSSTPRLRPGSVGCCDAPSRSPYPAQHRVHAFLELRIRLEPLDEHAGLLTDLLDIRRRRDDRQRGRPLSTV